MKGSSSSQSSVSSNRERLLAASRKLAQRSRAAASHTDTPTARGSSSKGGAVANVPGESGGGSVKKTLDFDTDSLDTGGTLVQVFKFPEFETSAMCNSVIGQGMFFCTDKKCLKPTHRNHKAQDKIGSPGKLYIPASGRGHKAFCEPCVDSHLISDDIVLFLLSNPYPANKLKWVLKELRSDPNALSLEELSAALGSETDDFRKKVKAVLTPAKCTGGIKNDPDSDYPIEPTATSFSQEYDEIIDTLEKGVRGLVGDITPPATGKLEGKHLDALVNAVHLTHNTLSEVTALGGMVSDEVMELRDLLGKSMIGLESAVGTDPGIGGVDTGMLSSSWEGIEFVHNAVLDLTEQVETSKQFATSTFKNMAKRLNDYSSELSHWEENISGSVIERSGRFASPLSEFIQNSVVKAIEDFGNEDGDVNEHGDVDDAPNPAPPSGVAWEGGRGGFGSGGNGGNGGDGGGGGGTGPPFRPGFDIDVNGEMTQLKKEFDLMRMELNHLKSVTSTGSLRFPMVDLEFESEEKLVEYMLDLDSRVKLPKSVSCLFGDFWAIMDEASRTIDGDQRQSSDSQIAKQQETATKADFSNTTALSRRAGFLREIPLIFEAPNTPVSPDPIHKPLPSLKKYEDLDNLAGGGQGRRQIVDKEFQRTITTLTSNIYSGLKGVELYKFLRFAEAYLTMVMDHERTLFRWIRNTYDTEKIHSSNQEAWSLVAGCIRAIFDEVKDARLIGRATDGLDGIEREARIIWAMGMGAMKLEKFKKLEYYGHPACQVVYNLYMNRCRTPMSAHTALETKVKSLTGEVAKLHTEIDKLKKKSSNRGQAQTQQDAGGN